MYHSKFGSQCLRWIKGGGAEGADDGPSYPDIRCRGHACISASRHEPAYAVQQIAAYSITSSARQAPRGALVPPGW